MAHHPKAGANFVPAYQTSAIPFVTSSVTGECKLAASTVAPVQVTFPYVTKFVTVNNTGTNDLRVAFTYSGSYAPAERTTNNTLLDTNHSRNYFIIKEQEAGSMQTVTFDVRCKTIFFLADNTGTTDFSLFAGLTTIPFSNFPVLTGSLMYSGSDDEPLNQAIPRFEGVG